PYPTLFRSQRATGLDLGLGVVPGQRLAQQLRAPLAIGDLHGAIAVLVPILDLGNAVGEHFNDRDGHGFAGFRKDSCHAALAADQTDCHLAILSSCGLEESANERETGVTPSGLKGVARLEWSWPFRVATRSRFRIP